MTGYQKALAHVVNSHEEEIRSEVELVSTALRKAAAESATLQVRLRALEALLQLAESPLPTSGGPARVLTLHEAMVVVLRDAPLRMLRAAELVAEINTRRLYRMRDGRPVEAQQVHARVGHYGHLFEREGTFIKLVESSTDEAEVEG